MIDFIFIACFMQEMQLKGIENQCKLKEIRNYLT